MAAIAMGIQLRSGGASGRMSCGPALTSEFYTGTAFADSRTGSACRNAHTETRSDLTTYEFFGDFLKA